MSKVDANDILRERGLDALRAAVDAKPPAGGKLSEAMFSAAELQNMVFPEIAWIVPGYIVEGCTILAGAPKIGKSWLLLDIAKAVADGGVCLGSIECDKGDVLYLALEDNRRRLQSRMRKLTSLTERWPANLTFATECP